METPWSFMAAFSRVQPAAGAPSSTEPNNRQHDLAGTRDVDALQRCQPAVDPNTHAKPLDERSRPPAHRVLRDPPGLTAPDASPAVQVSQTGRHGLSSSQYADFVWRFSCLSVDSRSPSAATTDVSMAQQRPRSSLPVFEVQVHVKRTPEAMHPV
jgi:hypothetical protein